MAYIAQDPNKQDGNNSTNVLGNSSAGTTLTSQNQGEAGSSAPTYVSNGNPYGKYGSPSSTQTSSAPSQSMRKTSQGASSGTHTNVQEYINKNQTSSQNLGQATAGQLKNTSDIAKQNLQSVENKFQQGMNAGSLENYQGAVGEAQKAFNEASQGSAAQREYKSNEASMYSPTKNTEGGYSQSDQDLIKSNKARVMYGDGSYKDFDTQAEATSAINSYNAQNPGYYTYGEESPLSVSNNRLSDILNASYKGPTELSEISGYGKAYNSFQDANQLQNQVLKGGDNTQLLEKTFATPNTQYTYGSKLLDQLLLGQGKANEILKDTAKGLGSTSSGKLSDEFSSRAKGARTQAAERTQEMQNVKNQAREALMNTANTRSKEVNDRINSVIENWESYPQYFRDRFQKELDSFGVKVDLNKEFKNIESKYGTLEQAQQSQKSIQDQLSGVQGFNYGDMYKLQQQLDPQLANLILTNFNQGGNNGKLQASINSLAQSTGSQDLVNKYTSMLNQFGTLRDATLNQNAYNNYGQAGASTVFTDPVEYIKSLTTAQRQALGIGSRDIRRAIDEGSINNLRVSGDIIGSMIANNNAIASKYTSGLSNQIGTIGADISKMNELANQGAGTNFDPNAFNLGLSQLEAEALGIKGGEGLYNLLKDKGIDSLIKTNNADRNQLVSQDEQSQLARLQSIAQLAKDYGVTGSGVNFANQYGDRDVAGNQNALSALDMDNFQRMLQGAERTFRNDAASSNISGSGYGTGSSGGLFGTKRAQAWKTLNQNFGDLINQGGGYRNIYSDEGMNKELLKQASQAAQGKEGFNLGNVDGGIVGGVQDTANYAKDMLSGLLGGKSNLATNVGTNYAMFSNPVTAPLAIANIVGDFVGGSSAKAQAVADRAAYANALDKLRNNITNKINTSGLKNQFTVNQNTNQDLELFKLLGMLDTTNL